MPKYDNYLLVPQSCYIEITGEEYTGLIARDMSSCYPVAVAVRGHIFLCHADDTTDISDVNHGVPAWVSLAACNPENEIVKIYLGSMYSDAENKYKGAICTSLECQGLTGKYEIITLRNISQLVLDSETGAVNEEIGDNQAARVLKDSALGDRDYFINCCVTRYYAKTHPPIHVGSSGKFPFYSASDLLARNGLWIIQATLNCKSKAEELDQIEIERTYFFKEALEYARSISLPDIESLDFRRTSALDVLSDKFMAGFLTETLFALGKRNEFDKIAMLASTLIDDGICGLPLSSAWKVVGKTAPAAAATSSVSKSSKEQKILSSGVALSPSMLNDYLARYQVTAAKYVKLKHLYCRTIIKQLQAFDRESFDYLRPDVLQKVVGSYMWAMFKPQPHKQIVGSIIPSSFIEHLEILIMSKVLEVNFVLLCPAYEKPLVFCNSSGKTRTICLIYDVFEDKRTYCAIDGDQQLLLSNLLKYIPEKPNMLPQISSAWLLALCQKSLAPEPTATVDGGSKTAAGSSSSFPGNSAGRVYPHQLFGGSTRFSESRHTVAPSAATELVAQHQQIFSNGPPHVPSSKAAALTPRK